MDVKGILADYGYGPFRHEGNFVRCKALYRNGKNPSSLRVNTKTGQFVDFNGESGDIYKLIALTTGKPYKEVRSKVDVNLSVESAKDEPEVVKYYPASCTDRLVQYYDFYTKKEFPISVETLETFKGGVAGKGKMEGRFVFPVWDSVGRIVGFAGRDLGDREPKWKILEAKKNFCHPLHLSKPFIQESGAIILVESIGDLLALWDCGIKNVLVLFGVSLFGETMKAVLSNAHTVYISTNNEPEKGNYGGNAAAKKIKNVLAEIMGADSVHVALPPKNDFGCMTKQEILLWKEKYIQEK